MSDYKVKYQLHFHTFNKTVEEKLEIASGTNFFDGERNRSVYSEKDACDYVRSTHKAGDNPLPLLIIFLPLQYFLLLILLGILFYL